MSHSEQMRESVKQLRMNAWRLLRMHRRSHNPADQTAARLASQEADRIESSLQ